MEERKTDRQSQSSQNTSFPPALLFMISAGLLMLMSAMDPSLALPLVAFAAMAAVTRLLGQRLYRDLTLASGQVN